MCCTNLVMKMLYNGEADQLLGTKTKARELKLDEEDVRVAIVNACLHHTRKLWVVH